MLVRRSRFCSSQLTLFLLFVYFASLSLPLELPDSDRLDYLNVTVSNTSVARPGTFADIIDRALEKEFTENEQAEGATLS